MLCSANTCCIRSLLNALKAAIANAATYDSLKLKTIAGLKNQLNNKSNVTLDELFQLNEQLYNEYKVFNYDSQHNFDRKKYYIGISPVFGSVTLLKILITTITQIISNLIKTTQYFISFNMI